MIRVVHKKKENPVPGYVFSALVAVACLVLLVMGTRSMARKAQGESLNALREAVRRASVQCYAIEGRYPPSVEYLEEHYGISIDRDSYYVFYDGWASNVMPDITILPVEPVEQEEIQ